MRRDMSKVVTEKPRRGSGYNNHRRNTVTATRGRVRPNVDDLEDVEFDIPIQSSGSARGQKLPYDSKNFTDVLGPLRRYLVKQVGRPWDKVNSELSKILSKRSLQGQHIWTHVWIEVEKDCYLGEDGKVYNRRYRWRPDPVSHCLYVHPRTGLLCKTKDYGQKWFRQNRDHSSIQLWRRLSFLGLVDPIRPKFLPKDWVIVSDDTVLQRLEGLWFVIKLKLHDPEEIVQMREVSMGRVVVTRRKDIKNSPGAETISRLQLGRRSPYWKMVSND